jgi:hypothetical protein
MQFGVCPGTDVQSELLRVAAIIRAAQLVVVLVESYVAPRGGVLVLGFGAFRVNHPNGDAGLASSLASNAS